MRDKFMKFSPPSIGREEVDGVLDCLESEWVTTGPRVRQFEQNLAEFFGVNSVVCLNSWTACAHAALVAMNVGPGDEVITTPQTFCATVNIIEHVGARPVLVDIDPETLNIDPARVAAVIGPRTRAIIPVHYAGHPCEMDEIRAAATECGAIVLEDAAHALPARYRGRLIGSDPNPCAFSFYVTKNLATIEGGAITGPPALLDRVRVLGLHGMSRDAWKRYDKGGSWKYDVVAPGFKYNMTDVQASVGLVQLSKLQRFQARRREVVVQYQAAFSSHRAFQVPVERAHVEHAWHLYSLRLNLDALTIDRDRFIVELTERNIGSSVHFIPIHLHSYYREKYGWKPDDLPIAYREYLRLISLPLHPRMSDGDVADVIAAVLDIAKVFAR